MQARSKRGGVQQQQRSHFLRLRPEEITFFDRLYTVGDPQNTGEVSAQTAYKLFALSDLPHDVLSAIWQVASEDRPSLNKDDFFVALRLVALAQAGHEIDTENILQFLDLPLPVFRQLQSPPPNNRRASNGAQVMNMSSPPTVMPAMQNRAPSFAPPAASAVAEDSDEETPDESTWAINDRDRMKYLGYFEMADQDQDHFISGEEAREFFSKSNLNPRQLRDIWKLSDADGDNRLTVYEFMIAMHLIMKVRTLNIAVPSTLPAPLAALLRPKSNSMLQVDERARAPPPQRKPTMTAPPRASSIAPQNSQTDDSSSDESDVGESDVPANGLNHQAPISRTQSAAPVVPALPIAATRNEPPASATMSSPRGVNNTAMVSPRAVRFEEQADTRTETGNVNVNMLMSDIVAQNIETQNQSNRIVMDEILEAQRKAAEYKREYEQLTSELSTLQAAGEKLRHELSDLQQQHAEQEAQSSKTMLEINELTVQNAQLDAEMADARQELQYVTEKTQTSSNIFVEHQQKLHRRRREISDVRLQISEMEAEQDRHRQGVQDIDSQMEMSAQELQSLRDRLKQITEMVTNQSMIVDSRSEQRLALSKERSVLVDQIAVAQRELAQQKHQNSLLKEETAHLQSELELLQSQHDDVSDLLKVERSEHHRLSTKLVKFHTEHADSKRSVASVLSPARAVSPSPARVPIGRIQETQDLAEVAPAPFKSPPKLTRAMSTPAHHNLQADPFGGLHKDSPRSSSVNRRENRTNISPREDGFGVFDSQSLGTTSSTDSPPKSMGKLKAATPLFEYVKPSSRSGADSDSNNPFGSLNVTPNPFWEKPATVAEVELDTPTGQPAELPVQTESQFSVDDMFTSLSARRTETNGTHDWMAESTNDDSISSALSNVNIGMIQTNFNPFSQGLGAVTVSGKVSPAVDEVSPKALSPRPSPAESYANSVLDLAWQ